MIYFRHDHHVDCCYLYHAHVPPYRLCLVHPYHLCLVPYQVALGVDGALDLVDLKKIL